MILSIKGCIKYTLKTSLTAQALPENAHDEMSDKQLVKLTMDENYFHHGHISPWCLYKVNISTCPCSFHLSSPPAIMSSMHFHFNCWLTQVLIKIKYILQMIILLCDYIWVIWASTVLWIKHETSWDVLRVVDWANSGQKVLSIFMLGKSYSQLGYTP